jgi:hypothetical protein
MAAISKRFGSGGANLTPASEPSLAEALRDIADDLATVQVDAVTSPAATVAAGATPTKAEFDAVVALVNELRTKVNPAAGTLKTTKAP